MAAMRNHQRHQSFDFPDSQQMLQHPAMLQQGMFTYTNLPTPPGNSESTNYMTPSPESPWSSASPQSQEGWSDGIHSPPANFQHQQIKQQQQQDGIFI
jgi:hypothetical protein